MTVVHHVEMRTSGYASNGYPRDGSGYGAGYSYDRGNGYDRDWRR